MKRARIFEQIAGGNEELAVQQPQLRLFERFGIKPSFMRNRLSPVIVPVTIAEPNTTEVNALKVNSMDGTLGLTYTANNPGLGASLGADQKASPGLYWVRLYYQAVDTSGTTVVYRAAHARVELWGADVTFMYQAFVTAQGGPLEVLWYSDRGCVFKFFNHFNLGLNTSVALTINIQKVLTGTGLSDLAANESLKLIGPQTEVP